jgi:hypothetical protein
MSKWTAALRAALLKQVDEELKAGIANDERVTSVVIIVLGLLLVSYLIAHQRRPTGFFTAAFGTLEALLLYGSIGYWMITSALLLAGQKDLSRDLDSFGGLLFATVGIARLLRVFPFQFAHFADVLPRSIRFLLSCMTNDIARVLMGLAFIGHAVAAGYTLILRLFVRRVGAARIQ